jgi:hypothetical protein
MTRPNRNEVAMILAAILACTTVARAQIEEDWAVFTDDVTVTDCDIVNGSNAEFVVLFETGELVTVAGRFTDAVVDLDDLSVSFEGEPAGFLAFREDADDLPTLFWLTLGETIVGIDTFTSEPFDSGQFPSERTNTLCDACEVVLSSLCAECLSDEDCAEGEVCDENNTCIMGTNGGNGGDGGDDGGFTPIFVCGSGANEGALVAALMLPIVGRLRRKVRK